MSVYLRHSFLAHAPIQDFIFTGVRIAVMGNMLHPRITLLTCQIKKVLQQFVGEVVIEILALACRLPVLSQSPLARQSASETKDRAAVCVAC